MRGGGNAAGTLLWEKIRNLWIIIYIKLSIVLIVLIDLKQFMLCVKKLLYFDEMFQPLPETMTIDIQSNIEIQLLETRTKSLISVWFLFFIPKKIVRLSKLKRERVTIVYSFESTTKAF